MAGTHGTVRLIGGLIPEEGTVEVCVYAVWSSVCQTYWDYWDYKDAFVVCRQLGYPATGEDDVVTYWLSIYEWIFCMFERKEKRKEHDQPLSIHISFLINSCL